MTVEDGLAWFVKLCHSLCDNGRRWKFVYCAKHFRLAKTSARTAANYVGLVTEKDKLGTFKDVKHTFTVLELVDFVKHAEQDRCYRGAMAGLRHMTF